MAALPYMQLYVADYLADTIHLTAEEHGAYLLLLFNYWQTGGAIPEDRLSAAAKIPNGSWPAIKDKLSGYFTEGENGEWVHDRIERDLEKVRSKSIQASNAGKASAAKRGGGQVAVPKGDSNGRSTPAERTLNHKETETETETEVLLKEKQEKESYPEWWPTEAWEAFVDHRKQIKKPLTKIAAKRIINKLTEANAETTLWASVENGWSGVFPDGGKNGKGKQSGRTLSAVERVELANGINQGRTLEGELDN